MSPTLAGMPAVKLLLAKTTTDTGELPSVDGICWSKRLLLTNSASSFLLKRSSGRTPLKLLNLTSKYTRLGKRRVTCGKLPEKRLLLTSSS